jgi:transposase
LTYTFLSRWENFSLSGRQALRKLRSVGFVEGVSTKIRVIQRRAEGLRGEGALA